MSVKEITDRQGRNFQVTTYDGHTMFRMVEEKLLPLGLAARLKELKNLTIRDDDVMICTFPKAGRSWCCFFIPHERPDRMSAIGSLTVGGLSKARPHECNW